MKKSVYRFLEFYKIFDRLTEIIDELKTVTVNGTEYNKLLTETRGLKISALQLKEEVINLARNENAVGDEVYKLMSTIKNYLGYQT